MIVLELEGGDGKGPGEAGRGLERDLPRGKVLNGHVADGEPDEKLLALHAGYLLHAAVLHEGCDLIRVRDGSTDRGEEVVPALALVEQAG